MRPVRVIPGIALLLPLVSLLPACSSDGGPKPYVVEGSVSTVSATVEAIDPATRRITLKGESGNSATFSVDDRVQNLERVKVGDRVNAAYVETVSIHVRDPDDAGKKAETAAHAEDWAKAADGTFSREASLTAVVEKVNRKKGAVVLRGPGGVRYPFQARDARNLENVKVGDEVVATRREMLAVALEPAGR